MPETAHSLSNTFSQRFLQSLNHLILGKRCGQFGRQSCCEIAGTLSESERIQHTGVGNVKHNEQAETAKEEFPHRRWRP